MNTFPQKGDAPSPQLYCCATRAWGEARKVQASVPWSMGAAFGARTPIAEFTPRLRETALEARVLIAELRPRPRGASLGARVLIVGKTYLAGGNHARSASSLRRYHALRIVSRRRRSPWALDRGNLCCVIGRASNRNTSIF